MTSYAYVQPLTYARAIRDDRKLSSKAKTVAFVMMTHAGNPKSPEAHPGNDLLVLETGLSLSGVKRGLEELCEAGYLIQTYSGRGGRRDRASAYVLAVPKVHTDTLPMGQDEPKGDSNGSNGEVQRFKTEGSKVHSEPTDAFRTAPRDAPTSRRSARTVRTARTTIKEREEREVITQEDIDYRDISRAGFTEALGESFSPSLESLAKLQQEWPNPDKIPYDHIVVGCLGWNQYKGMMNGQTTQDVGIDSLPRILGHHLKADDVKSLAIKGWQQINRYEEESGNRAVDDSGYDPRVCYQDVDY
jgi:hypothetical protein